MDNLKKQATARRRRRGDSLPESAIQIFPLILILKFSRLPYPIISIKGDALSIKIFPLLWLSVLAIGVFPIDVHAQEWQLVASGEGEYLKRAHFITENVGWAVGDGGLMLKTTDGGYSWIEINPEPNMEDYFTIYFKDQNNGWATGWRIGEGLMLRTTNGGSLWVTDTLLPGPALRTIEFVSPDTGWIVGGSTFSGVVLKTTNGGEDWIQQGEELLGSFIGGCSFLNGETGWIGGGESYMDNFENAIVYRTDDGGDSWTNQQVNKGGPLYSIDIGAGETGMIGGRGGSMRTTDGGITWVPTGLPETHLICMIDERHVHFRSYEMYFTSDLGQSWTEIPKPEGGGINGLFFLDTLTGWGVGGTEGRWDVWKFNPYGPTSVDNLNNPTDYSISIYPNPVSAAQQSTTLRYTTGKPGSTQIVIYDMLGRQVYSTAVANATPGEQQVELSLHGLLPGLYIIQASSTGGKMRAGYTKLIIR